MSTRTIFWDVDTQHDFMMANGRLAVPCAEALIDNLAALTRYAHEQHITIVATADDHDIGHAEITDTPDWQATFPPHCMRGTPGQLKVPATTLRDVMLFQPVGLDEAEVRAAVIAHRGDFLLNKPGTDVFRWNPNAATVLDALQPGRIVVYGVATDFCTRAAVEGIARLAPTAELLIVEDGIRGISAETSAALITSWRAAGHRIVKTREIIT